jgi:hypothetical protein
VQADPSPGRDLDSALLIEKQKGARLKSPGAFARAAGAEGD